MKLLIAISSCYDFEKNGNNQVLRNTWLMDAWPNGKTSFVSASVTACDYKFFFGRRQGAESANLPDDCVFLQEVDDAYGDLTRKTQDSLCWASERGYDFVYRCFPDTYCRPERLVSCGFEAHDYHGDFRGEHCTPDNYPSGGPGYFLSRKAFELVLDAPITGPEATGKHTRVWHYAEDLWVGQVLNWHRDKGLKYFDDNRFVNRGTTHPGPLKSNSVISTHLSCPDRYYPDRMITAHRAWLTSQ